MFTRKNIVINRPMRRFSNKIGYTLCSKTILFNCYTCSIMLFEIQRPTLPTAQTFNCTIMRFQFSFIFRHK